MSRPADAVPNLVRDTLDHDGGYDFGLGVVLRAPTDPGGRGASASYRIEYRTSPVVPGQPRAPRRFDYTRDLAAAFARAQQRFEQMQQLAAGTWVEYHTDVPFGEVVKRWLDSPHPRWGEHYPAKVRSLLRCWVLADRVTVRWGPSATPTPIAAVPIGGLTADHFNQALDHARAERAHRTYTEVHGLVVRILKWALVNRYLRPEDGRVVDMLPLASRDDGAAAIGATRAIPPEEIPPLDRIEDLVAAARELRGRGTGLMFHLLAFTGLRISECLALRHDDRFQRTEDGCWRIEVREQVARSRRATLPPKWRKHRWTFVPHWLTDDVAWLLEATEPGAPLFPSPGRRVRTADGTLARIDRGLNPYNNWRERIWTPVAEATEAWPERDDWWAPHRGPAPQGMQSQRRWLWPVHSLRHVCATYQLNVLGLDPDDVAKFLGHRSGVQVWEMYVRVRSDLFGRAGAASRAAGDPRR